MSKKVRTCRICGCTDDHACPGGCVWVDVDLCSACIEKADMPKAELEPVIDFVGDDPFH